MTRVQSPGGYEELLAAERGAAGQHDDPAGGGGTEGDGVIKPYREVFTSESGYWERFPPHPLDIARYERQATVCEKAGWRSDECRRAMEPAPMPDHWPDRYLAWLDNDPGYLPWHARLRDWLRLLIGRSR